jgi:hypothetical protein
LCGKKMIYAPLDHSVLPLIFLRREMDICSTGRLQYSVVIWCSQPPVGSVASCERESALLAESLFETVSKWRTWPDRRSDMSVSRRLMPISCMWSHGSCCPCGRVSHRVNWTLILPFISLCIIVIIVNHH